MDWKVPYIIEKLLEFKCLKWACMTYLDIWNTSYGQKKSRESNRQFDSRPLKVKNHPDFLVCRWRATYHWKALDKGYNFALDLISIGGLHAKLRESQMWKFRDSHLGILGQNDIWVLVQWRSTKYIIKGKVVMFRPWWVLWVQVCPWLILASKVLQLCTNQHIVWFCASSCEWVITCHSS
jgi:hypothetical protein